MVSTKEFYEEDAYNLMRDLEIYRPQHEKNGRSYIISGFPSKEEVMESYEAGLDDPWDDISDEDDITEEMKQKLVSKYKEEIGIAYDDVARVRKKFILEHGLEEFDYA